MKLAFRRRGRDWALAIGGVALALVVVVVFLRRADIIQTALDPKQPFQTWSPPPAPNYARPQAWALLPPDPLRWGAGDPPADVFFVHPTSFDGGRDWNAPYDAKGPARQLARTMLPNYAGPFQRVGRVFAPRYRQASLYAQLTNRDDAREARRFAYADVRAAFIQYVTTYNRGRPLILVGVEQGGLLAARLLDELVATNPALVKRTAAVYLIESVEPAPRYDADAVVPACAARAQARCVVGWVSAKVGDEEAAQRVIDRAFVWNLLGALIPLGDRLPLCVNPLTGAADTVLADPRRNLGAANASGLEWGARPAFLPRQVSAQCKGGVLRVSSPTSPSLVIAGAWADRQKVPPYNLFYADLESDAKNRVATLMGRADFPVSAPSIDQAVEVRDVPIRKVR
jgi:hypothetical protein